MSPRTAAIRRATKEVLLEHELYLLAQRLAAKMSNLEISTAVFPTLTLVWKYLQVNLQFHIYSAPHEEWTISIHPSSEDLEVKDRTNEDWLSLVDAERERPLRTTNPTAS
jgi:hypothetical protein